MRQLDLKKYPNRIPAEILAMPSAALQAEEGIANRPKLCLQESLVAAEAGLRGCKYGLAVPGFDHLFNPPSLLPATGAIVIGSGGAS